MLIVDDDTIAANAVAQGVAWKDFGIDGHVWIARSAAQAEEIIDRGGVDIVLCDIEMPGGNGIELISKVRAANSEIICMFLTCHEKFQYAKEAVRLGCYDYIVVPAPYEVIAGAVRKAADNLRDNRRSRKAREYGSYLLSRHESGAAGFQGSARDANKLVSEVVAYITENLGSRDLSLGKLAERIYINKDYLNRIFKRAKGVPVNQFIIQERMKLSTVLLEDRGLNVSAVATQVGYTNYSYFLTAFKAFYGCSPSQYRQRPGRCGR
jgi:YesN/AraC family two-component response regulator